jgi:Ni/Co efflux regulator RcnB
MKIRISAVLLPLLAFMAFYSATSSATAPLSVNSRGLEKVQYRGYRDDSRGDYRGRPDESRGGYDDARDYRGPKWRPGQVLPGPFLFRVVDDWEDRGLSRPPNGHEWVRVGQQFILVRVQDRMIARILNFD